MKYQYKDEWYRGVEDTVKPSAGSAGAGLGRRGFMTTLASLALCAAASYMAGGIIGNGALAADVMTPMDGGVSSLSPSEEDAAFVMSWVFDDAGTDGEDTDGAETVDEQDEHDAHIRELAEAYIEERTEGGAD